jgi:signal transduction histidine kinase
MTFDTAALRRAAVFPWSGRVRRSLAFVALSCALDLLPLGVLSAPWLITASDPPTSVPVILAAVFVPLVIVVLLGPWLTGLRRACFYEAMGIEIPLPPSEEQTSGPGFPRSQRELSTLLHSPRTWRQACYHLVAGPAVHLLGLAASAVWLGAIGDVVGFAFFALKSAGHSNWEGSVAIFCAVLVYLAPWTVTAAVDLDVRAATNLLGPSRAEQLAQRVATLTESRAGVVDAADAERRRIERDLHDGTQQRLVSLAMNLGLARATLPDLPEAADRALREAHDEAKAALTELRDLVRGLHPVVLEDRGLDAALSGIAARSPVPVRLSVQVSRRVSPTVEAVAYFTVSEALANVAKHAQATTAQVTVTLTEDQMLRIIVTDDGVGGADAGQGTGLTGLAQRAASVDGAFRLSSPLGGPTTIKVDLPCEL